MRKIRNPAFSTGSRELPHLPSNLFLREGRQTSTACGSGRPVDSLNDFRRIVFLQKMLTGQQDWVTDAYGQLRLHTVAAP
jgi:hypothetical protein